MFTHEERAANPLQTNHSDLVTSAEKINNQIFIWVNIYKYISLVSIQVGALQLKSNWRRVSSVFSRTKLRVGTSRLLTTVYKSGALIDFSFI